MAAERPAGETALAGLPTPRLPMGQQTIPRAQRLRVLPDRGQQTPAARKAPMAANRKM